MAEKRRAKQSQYDYAVFDVDDPGLVGQVEETMYNDGEQALFSIVDNLSKGFEWALVASWRNDTAAEATVQFEYTTEFRVTEGKELESIWNIGHAFSGLSVGIGGGRKTFTPTETTTTKTRSVTMTLPKGESVYLYQKVYRFKSIMWFISEVGESRAKVGGRIPADRVTTVEGNVDIASSEYWTRSEELPHTVGTAEVEWIKSRVHCEKVLPWNNISPRARTALEAKNVRPAYENSDPWFRR